MLDRRHVQSHPSTTRSAELNGSTHDTLPLPQLQEAIYNRVSAQESSVELDMLAWMTRTALELIGQAGLGHSFDPLVADSMDAFSRAVKSFGYVSSLLASTLPGMPM